MRRLISHVVALAVAVIFVAVSLCVPVAAKCSTYTEGTASRPFALTDTGGLLVLTDESGDPYLTPPYEAATTFDGTSIEFEPRSIREAADGSLFVACGKHGYILRIGGDGRTRKYTKSEIPGLERPFDVYPLEDDGMLIVDRAEQGFGRVFKVDRNLRTTWEFGGSSGMGAGQVFDPFTAEPLPDGNTLITDSLGYRVIEVNAAGSVVWSYGTFRVEGPGPGLLIRPHSAQRLANGNTLICDAEAHKVIEVTRAGQITWSYGTGVPGIGRGQLNSPNSALRLANGNTLISDSSNNRVIEVTQGGKIVQCYGDTQRTPTHDSVVDPRAAMRRSDGSTLIADLGKKRIARYRYRPNREYTATSAKIDLSVGVVKAFSKIRAATNVPAGASVALEYQIDNEAWMGVPRNGSLPANAIGSTVHYRVRLATSSTGAAPTIGEVAVTWVKAGTATASKPKPKGGSTSHTGSTSHSQAASTSAAPATSTAPNTETSVGKVDVLVPGFVAPSAQQGGLASATKQSTTMSGWVMREAETADAGFGRNTGSDAMQGRVMSRQAAPSMALLLLIYSTGLMWSPVSRLLLHSVLPAIQH